MNRTHYIKKICGQYEIRDFFGQVICMGETKDAALNNLVEYLAKLYKH